MVIGAGSQTNVLRAGTPVMLKTMRELTTKGKHLKVGDRFPLEVSESVLLNGQVVIPIGSPAVGGDNLRPQQGNVGKIGKYRIEIALRYSERTSHSP